MENINKYSNTTIYQIICKDRTITDCYVGHTTNFKSRKREHKHDCNNSTRNKYSFKVYQFIRENGGFENFDMLLISTHVCEDKHDAIRLERLYIEELNPTLNKQKPGRTSKEYKEDNKDKIRQQQHEYYEQRNKEALSKNKKAYRDKYKDRIHARNRELYIFKKEQLRHSNENQDFHDNSKNLTILVLIIIINLMHKHYINL